MISGETAKKAIYRVRDATVEYCAVQRSRVLSTSGGGRHPIEPLGLLAPECVRSFRAVIRAQYGQSMLARSPYLKWGRDRSRPLLTTFSPLSGPRIGAACLPNRHALTTSKISKRGYAGFGPHSSGRFIRAGIWCRYAGVAASHWRYRLDYGPVGINDDESKILAALFLPPSKRSLLYRQIGGRGLPSFAPEPASMVRKRIPEPKA